MQHQSNDPLELLKKQLTDDCNQAQLARKMGISPQYLSEILREQRPPSDIVLDYLGLERVITYQPKTAGAEPKRARRRRRA